MKGLKNEENARHMVLKDLEVLKNKMKNMNMGSGCTVCKQGWSKESGRPRRLLTNGSGMTQIW